MNDYVRAAQMNPYLLAGFNVLKEAFATYDARMESPSIDGYVRRVSLPNGRSIVFTADGNPLNSAAAHSLANDKLAAYQVLSSMGVRVPFGVAFFAPVYEDRDTHSDAHLLFTEPNVSLYFPFIDSSCVVMVKPGKRCRSFLVKACRTLEEVKVHAEKVLAVDPYVLIQEYIAPPEYRIVILDEEVLLAYRKQERTIAEGGRRVEREKPVIVNPADEIIQVARKSHSALGLRYSGVDVCHPASSGPAVVLEVNANPGLDFLYECYPVLAKDIASKVARRVCETRT